MDNTARIVQADSPTSAIGIEDKVYEAESKERMARTDSGSSSEPSRASLSWKKTLWQTLKEPGSALQIIIAAAIALGLAIGISQATEVPNAAVKILIIPGTLWLRALTAVVLPLIICSMILAVQRLREVSKTGPRLAKYTVGFYVLTTLLAIGHSTLMTGLVWRKVFVEMTGEALDVSESDATVIADRSKVAIEDVVTDMFNSFVARNIVQALAENALLAVLIVSIVVGYLIKDKDSILLKLVREVEAMITIIITFLIKLAPIGVFFLILSNMMKLNIAEIGENLGYLIGGTLVNMSIHFFILMPAIFFAFTRKNPYSYMFKCGSALMTAWGTASSAATMPVTLREARKRGNPAIVTKFAIPLGTLVNMDGTAIYFPIVVNFLAATQGITLNAAKYVVLILLSTLASIGTTPIPSASLVLVVMIATSINVPITGVYGLVTAIDWFLDRFRTMLNVNGDLIGVAVITKLTNIRDDDVAGENYEDMVQEGEQALHRRQDV